jgi:hypothetical protein
MTVSMFETSMEAATTNGVGDEAEAGEMMTSTASLGEPADVFQRTGQFIQI